MTFTMNREATLPSSWTQFLSKEPSEKTSVFNTIHEIIAAGLMLDHLHRWFLVQPESSDPIWIETSERPPMFVTMVGSLTHPVVKTSEGSFYFPKIQWNTSPQITERSSSFLVIRILSQSSKELQSFVYSLHPEWTWMTFLDHPSAILLNTVLSLQDFLQAFSNEMESLPSLFEYEYTNLKEPFSLHANASKECRDYERIDPREYNIESSWLVHEE